MTKTIEVHVIDQFENPVSCQVSIPGANTPETRSTGDDGMAYFQFSDTSKQYIASVQPLDGYTLTDDSTTSFQPDSSDNVYLSVTKNALVTIPPGTTHQLIISLKPLSWADRDGLVKKIPDIVSRVMGAILPYTSKYEVVGDGQFVNDNIIINLRKVR